MFIIVLGQHVSILIESTSGPSTNTDSYLAMCKMYCVIPNITTYAFYTEFYQDCKCLGSDGAF